MAELSPQERFNQLLSFLKDPQAHPHPSITLDNRVRLKKYLEPLRLEKISQEAIGIMESGMFYQGLLKGNRRTPGIVIGNIEHFVLELATATLFAKHQSSGSLYVYYLDSDGEHFVIEHLLITTHDNMMEVFEKYANILLNPPPPVIEGRCLVRRDKLQRIGRTLDSLLGESIKKIKEETSFDVVKEFILIFLKNIPEAPNNLIAHHITKFINERRNNLLKGSPPLWQDTVRKRVEKLRKLSTPTPL